MKTLFEKFIVVIFAILGFTVLVAFAYWCSNLVEKSDRDCTPSQDTQQILQAISGNQLSMEYLVTEALEFNCKK